MFRIFLAMSSACHWFLKVSNLFQHLTPGFEPVFMILELVLIHVQPISAFYLWFSAVVQTISWFYHWFLSNSNLCQELYHCFPSNCTTYFSISIGLQSLFRIFQQLTMSVHLFFPLPGLVFICFLLPFFVSSAFIIVSLFFHFLCSSIFILFITCFPFGIVFTWSLLWYIVSSILIICNCFIFRFHHISYIYCCPFPSILFQRDPKTPSRSELLVQKIMYAMHTVCFISCLRLATEQHCTLPQTGVNGKVYLIIPEIKTHTLAEVDEELLRGVKGFGGWVSLLYQNISSNINKHIYIYVYLSTYLPIYLPTYLSIYLSIYHSNKSNIFQEIYIHTKQGKTWKCEALKNIYVNFVWLIGLGNQNYPHLGKRVSDGTSEPWNQTNRGYPNQKKWHVISRSEIKYVYIYIYTYHFL